MNIKMVCGGNEGGGGGFYQDQTSYTSGIQTFNCGFRPKHILLVFSISGGGYVVRWDEDYQSGTKFRYSTNNTSWSNQNVGQTGSGVVSIYEITDTGFSIYNSPNMTIYDVMATSD